jgi:hypothetical protein
MRNLLALAISPVLALTGYRFSKDYRWGTTHYHRIVYAIINTPRANIAAYKLTGE